MEQENEIKKKHEYKLSVINGTKSYFDRYFVYANDVKIGSDVYLFVDENGLMIASYPIGRTIIESVKNNVR